MNYITQTNHYIPFKADCNERRYVAFQADMQSYTRDKTYFDPLYDAIENPLVQRAFYDYLMNIDFSTFRPWDREQMSKTKVLRDMQEINLDPIIPCERQFALFINYKELEADNLYSFFRDTRKEMGYGDKQMTFTMFGRKLKWYPERTL